jgi:predicted dehydrogenase
METKMDTRLRIGIVGCGKIADGHAEVIRYLPNAYLASVCDREPLIAEQLAVRYGVAKWYSDLNDMLETEHLDVLHITTPPDAHLPITQQAAAAGCHVFLEKPIATCLCKAQRIIETMQAAGKQLSINYWPNFEGPALELKDYLSSGLLGDPVHIESYVGYDLAGSYGKALMEDPEHWVHRLPGKMFQNMMDHIFNRVIPLLPEGEPELHAFALKRRTFNRDDATDSMLDELRVILRADSVTAYSTLSSHARPVGNTLRVYGSRNTVEVDYNRRTFIVQAAQKYPSAIGRLVPPFQMAERYFCQGASNLRAFGRSEFQFFAGMSTLLARFYQGILERRPPPIEYREILRVAAIMDRVIDQVYPKVDA